MSTSEPIATVSSQSPRQLGMMVGVFALVGLLFVLASPGEQEVTCRWEGETVRCRGTVGTARTPVDEQIQLREKVDAYEYRRMAESSTRRVTVCGLRRAGGEHLFDVPCGERGPIAIALTKLASEETDREEVFSSGSSFTPYAGGLAIFAFGLVLAVAMPRERRFYLRDGHLVMEKVRLVSPLNTQKTFSLSDITQVQLEGGGSGRGALHNTWIKLADGRTQVLAAGPPRTLEGQQALAAHLQANIAARGNSRDAEPHITDGPSRQ